MISTTNPTRELYPGDVYHELKRANAVLAWHFLPDNGQLQYGHNGRYNVTPHVGKMLREHGDVRCCIRGMHASIRAIDALAHAPGLRLCRVACWGMIHARVDKLAAEKRAILWMAEPDKVAAVFRKTIRAVVSKAYRGRRTYLTKSMKLTADPLCGGCSPSAPPAMTNTEWESLSPLFDAEPGGMIRLVSFPAFKYGTHRFETLCHSFAPKGYAE